MIRVFGDEIPLRAQVKVLNGYSAHGDRHELQAWLDAVRAGNPGQQPPVVHLVHGEPDAQDAFAAQLRAAGYPTVNAPEPHTTTVL
jgi:metallo-beta-lactamase family protein